MERGDRSLNLSERESTAFHSGTSSETRISVETTRYSAAPFEGAYIGRCTQIAYTVSPEVQEANGFTNPDVLIFVKTSVDPLTNPSSNGQLFNINHFDGADKIPLRVSSACLPGSLGDVGCNCHTDSIDYLKQINEKGVGVFIYLPQEALGRGLREKVRDHRLIYGIDNDGRLIPPVTTDEALKTLHPEGYDIRKYQALRDIFEELGLSDLEFENLGENDQKRLEIIDQTRLRIHQASEDKLPN